ncbi:MAG: hypothetical protein WA656_09050, partial [Pseudolabrys sp.]
VVARDLRRRLAGSEAAVYFGALEMLTTRTRSSHNIYKNMRLLSKRKEICGSGNDRPQSDSQSGWLHPPRGGKGGVGMPPASRKIPLF